VCSVGFECAKLKRRNYAGQYCAKLDRSVLNYTRIRLVSELCFERQITTSEILMAVNSMVSHIQGKRR